MALGANDLNNVCQGGVIEIGCQLEEDWLRAFVMITMIRCMGGLGGDLRTLAARDRR